MKRLWFDTETYSEIDLFKGGTHAYAEDDSAEIMVAQWAIDDGEPVVEDLFGREPPSAELVAHLEDPDVQVCAHFSHFDRTLVRECWGIDVPIERWYDTGVQAMAHGVPGGLDKIGKVIDATVDQAKDKRGRDLIQLFCKPRPKNQKLRRATPHTHPNEWDEFLTYSRQDIVAMRHVGHTLPTWNYKPGHAELALWHLDQKINDRGFLVDLRLADGAIAAVKVEQIRLKREINEATAGAVTSASKRDQLLKYILAEYGVNLPDLKKDTLERRVNDPDLPDGVRFLIALRLEATKTGVAKYVALKRAVSADGRLRNTVQFAGAPRTARWAGRIFQPQNMMRPDLPQHEIAIAIEALSLGVAHLYDADVMRLASNAVRGCIIAPPGKKLCVADLANIEGRGLAFLAGETWKLKAFTAFDTFVLDENGERIPVKDDWLRVGEDLYAQAYARAFNVTAASVMENKKTGDGMQRQIGKVMELGLGFGGGVAAFLTFAIVYSLDLDAMANAVWQTATHEALENARGMLAWVKKQKRSTFGLSDRVYVACELLKRAWRDAHPNTEALWDAADAAVRSAIFSPGQTFRIGKHLAARVDGAWLRIRLPSGRYLCYTQPKVSDSGEISYMGVSQYTRQWTRVKTYGGKLIENCIARGTLVVTERGLVPIERVRGERVWDGVEWVSHAGLHYSGKQTTMTAFGVRMTPDHFVLTTEGWRSASSSEGLDRAESRLPDCAPVCRQRWPEVVLGSGMRVWPVGQPPCLRADEAIGARGSNVVRVHAPCDYRQTQHHARDVEASGFRRVAQHARSLSAALASGLGQLRRSGHQGVCTLAGIVRELLGRHGVDLSARADTGARQERSRLFADKLPLEDVYGPGQQSTGQRARGHAGRSNDAVAGGPALRVGALDAGVAHRPGLARAEGVDDVYDLMDCGPRNRFVVVSSDGRPLIVHNCTQAFARDVMAHNMPLVEKAGYEIVLTVHDEVITETPDTDDYSSDDLSRILATVPPWAAGMPIAAAGFESDRYRKD